MKSVFHKLYRSVQTLLNGFQPDIVAAYTASTAWFIVLSFLPFMIMLLSLIQFLPLSNDALSYLDLEFIPETIQQLLDSVISEITQNTPSVVLPIAAVTGLISASTGFDSLIKGLNIVYQRRETRSFWIVRAMCVLYTVIFLLVIVAVLAMLVFGRTLYHTLIQMFPFLTSGLLPVVNLRFIAAMVVLVLFFTLLYKTVPDRKVRWFAEIPGAVIAAVMWMAFSYLYSLYISNFSRFSAIYGSLTVVILFMIWLYSCIYILFIGAYINVLLQKSRASKILKKPTK